MYVCMNHTMRYQIEHHTSYTAQLPPSNPFDSLRFQGFPEPSPIAKGPKPRIPKSTTKKKKTQTKPQTTHKTKNSFAFWVNPGMCVVCCLFVLLFECDYRVVIVVLVGDAPKSNVVKKSSMVIRGFPKNSTLNSRILTIIRTPK